VNLKPEGVLKRFRLEKRILRWLKCLCEKKLGFLIIFEKRTLTIFLTGGKSGYILKFGQYFMLSYCLTKVAGEGVR